MLRPATLLPALSWLLTPRFDGRPLDRRRGPANGLSGDYPCGTCTRWNDAARNDTVVRVHGRSGHFVRTHHGADDYHKRGFAAAGRRIAAKKSPT